MRVADGPTGVGISSSAISWVGQWLSETCMSQVWSQNRQIYNDTKAHIINQLQVVGIVEREVDMRTGTVGGQLPTPFSAPLLTMPWDQQVGTETRIVTTEAVAQTGVFQQRGPSQEGRHVGPHSAAARLPTIR